MENSKSLISELTQGKELLNQLRPHLSYTSTTGELLMEKVVATLNNALSILNSNECQVQVSRLGSGVIESGSLGSEDTDVKSVCKKRKMMFRWSEQVPATQGTGFEGPPEDDHSWRKYGQKDILGAKYPRSYYRCTHRNVKGCLARKQVQRSDEDPLVFEVTYRGKHTCTDASEAPAKQDQNRKPGQPKSGKQSEELLKKLRSGLKVKTENQDDRELTFPPFSFPPTAPIEDIKLENNIFSSLSLDSTYMDSFSPFLSPTTPEPNYFSPFNMNNLGSRTHFNSMESDLNDMISASTSPSNSPAIGLDFTLDSLNFDSQFPFDPNFFN